VEGSWRAHQVPLASVADNSAHLKVLEKWMRSYQPEDRLDADGKFRSKGLCLPDFRDYGIDVKKPGEIEVENTRPLGNASLPSPTRGWDGERAWLVA
jgi:xylulose-5-phosphate/fructose-6-phosphate phosphoketolase